MLSGQNFSINIERVLYCTFESVRFYFKAVFERIVPGAPSKGITRFFSLITFY